MTRANAPFGDFLSSAVVVIGPLPELAEMSLGTVTIERLGARALDAITPTTTAIVIDLRGVPFDDVVSWRTSIEPPPAPLVLVSDRALGEDAIDGVRADEVLVLPRDALRTVERRLRQCIELGRARLSLLVAEQALQQSVTGLAIADASLPNVPIVSVSRGLERLTQYDEREIVGQTCRLLQRDDVGQAGALALGDALRRHAHATAVVRNYRKDGSAFWNEVTVFPITVNGSPTGWMGGVHHDVTNLADAQAEVASLYQRLADQRTFDQAILDGIDVGIITTDREGQILFANRCATSLLANPAIAPGAHVSDVLHLPCLPDALLGGESRWTARHTVVTPDGPEVELDIALSRADGRVEMNIGFFFIFRDSREERQRAEEHRRFERLAALGTMVAGFAHEVRNPVAALRSIAEELGEELTQAGLMLPHAGRMLRVLERMERLVRSSLRFGRPDVPKRASHRPWIVCSAALTTLSPRLIGGEQLRVEMDPDLPSVFVDDGQIVQALVVLLDNAIDAVGSTAGVWLKVHAPRAPDSERPRASVPVTVPMVRFEVSDSGPGISATDLPRIFDPFFTTKPSGTGLGLSIAQQLVSENGGRIEVSSGRGVTTFTLLVPIQDTRSLVPAFDHDR